jgi:hypothetical protein
MSIVNWIASSGFMSTITSPNSSTLVCRPTMRDAKRYGTLARSRASWINAAKRVA